MNGSPKKSDHGQFQEVVRRFLGFTPAIEMEFDTTGARRKHLLNASITGLVVYHLFIFSEYRQIPDVFGWNVVTHFGILTPIYAALMAIVIRWPKAWVRKGCLFLAIVLMIATIFVLFDHSRAPDRDMYLFSVTIVALFATFLLRMRFKYTIAASIFTMVGFAFEIAKIPSLSVNRVLSFDLLMFSILVLLLIGSYSLEAESRARYLLRVRDRIRNAELEALGLRDALTGVGNRRALDATFARLMSSRGDRAAAPTAILMLDIDHFKSFNDLNGHQAGDLCLQQVAATVRRVIETIGGDIYRFGGEEFAVVLEIAQPEQVRIVAEAIRAAVANEAIPCEPAGDPIVTVSIGATIGVLGQDATPASLIAAADDALYSAKRSGRNQVWIGAPREPSARGGADRMVA